jgi:hypothetical protein
MHEAADSSIPDMEEKSSFGLGLYVHDTLNIHLIGIVLRAMCSAADCFTKVAGKKSRFGLASQWHHAQDHAQRC